MFSRSRPSGHGRHNFGRPKKNTSGKRHGIRTWIFMNKKKDRHHERVMMSGDSPPPPLRTSSPPSPGFDIPDDPRAGKNSPTGTAKISRSTADTEAIEEAIPIIDTLPSPEPKPKIEKNGQQFDVVDGKKKLVEDEEPDSCVIKCLSFTQQCCECTIQ
ncbi:uncharacterized protein LOC124300031 isoform X1 [Neodiprion virginianus]|uniref:uncharacterized protein LOC124300031 isoform X1 n=1 Tax=Neodiprion virginianus TaxID=2961670 RepID=UPI001EE6F63F|nr:uncharacterized protein LOC124300031 isoform X1 [Neodiprion virginianus]XP_046609596.1 uncharacterized protein LOC124300031 isoform X1 [Neodiprion virginianus]XP_046609597.1 uncharacterized protein LOC124300031 isoform X1 [Neodiprion virginianus]XP_046609598.1 uncharacterized protein LOC124300031 isoform X1 [Neodiprion virginianus]XP_046609599.1 uncharacterized protein LOC124300031 isoform X1 [Neodiprion virginianus]XP_046609600.1 uncharacterized protein LOC124300031 isoform X1 [Neodiprion 